MWLKACTHELCMAYCLSKLIFTEWWTTLQVCRSCYLSSCSLGPRQLPPTPVLTQLSPNSHSGNTLQAIVACILNGCVQSILRLISLWLIICSNPNLDLISRVVGKSYKDSYKPITSILHDCIHKLYRLDWTTGDKRQDSTVGKLCSRCWQSEDPWLSVVVWGTAWSGPLARSPIWRKCRVI